MKPIVVLAAILTLVSCGKDIQNNEAVRQAVIDDVAKRQAQTGLNMSMMQIDIASVSFRKNAADAVVSFKPKNMASEGMRMNYVLERKGDKWVVTGRQASATSSHGNVPLPNSGDGAGQTLPPGHPRVDPNATPKNPGTVK